MSAGPRRMFAEIAGAPLRPGTWLNVVYVLIAFPLGLMYFVFLVIGGSLGIGLSLLWVGIPLILVTVAAWWLFATLERVLARALLGMDVPYAPRPWETAEGVVNRVRAHFSSASTWRDLAFVLLKFPLGLFSFVVMAAAGGAATALIVSPAFGPWSTGRGAWVGLWRIDTWWEAVIAVLAGLLALIVALNLANALAALWRIVAAALLGDDARPGDTHDTPRTPASGV